MRYIAVFLILNILLLSSISGIAGIPHGTVSCRNQHIHKDCCKQSKRDSSDDCAKGNCNAMLSCGTCGFVITASVSISPIISILNSKTVPPFSIDELSEYYGNGWNPPKV